MTARWSNVVAVVSNLKLEQLDTRLALLFIVLAPADIQEKKALKIELRCAQQPDYTYTGSP